MTIFEEILKFILKYSILQRTHTLIVIYVIERKGSGYVDVIEE